MSDDPETVEFQEPEAEESERGFPSVRYGPDGASMVCHGKADVPVGWVDHPSKVKGAPDPSLDTAEKRRSRAELTKALRTRGIEFKPNAGSAELDKLLSIAEQDQDEAEDEPMKPKGRKAK